MTTATAVAPPRFGVVPPAFVRAHRWSVIVFVVAAGLRLLSLIAYYPALEFFGDSYSYLANANHLTPDLWHPLVYPVFLRLVAQTHLLVLVPLIQHLMGLATGALIYRLLRRNGLSDLAATLGAAPVLLDAWQVDVEQIVLTEALFGLLLVAGVYLLTGGRPTLRRCLAGGLLLSAAVLTRTVGVPVALIAVALLAWRHCGKGPVLAAVAALLVPLAGYAIAFHAAFGSYALQGYSGRDLYGEVATFARCDGWGTATDRQLCPHLPVAQRPGNNQYTWSRASPLYRLPVARSQGPHAVLALNRTAGAFARAVIRRQPLSYLRVVLDMTVRYFRPGRVAGPRDFPQVAWQFPARTDPPPPWNVDLAHRGFFNTAVHPHLLRPVATGLRAYQRVGYLPGPLLLMLALLPGVAVCVNRRDRAAWSAAALSVAGLGTLVVPSTAAGFDYRYVLPALWFVPPAGVFAFTRLRVRRIRPPHWWRFGVLGVAGVVAAANSVGSGLVPLSRQMPQRLFPIGMTTALGDGLRVTVNQPRVLGWSCVKSAPGHRVKWLVVVDVTATTSRPTHLVQMSNLAVVGGGVSPYVGSRWSPMAPHLPDVLLSASRRHVRGLVGFLLLASAGTLLYTDPTGSGVAGWRFNLSDPAAPPAGRQCEPSRPGGGPGHPVSRLADGPHTSIGGRRDRHASGS